MLAAYSAADSVPSRLLSVTGKVPVHRRARLPGLELVDVPTAPAVLRLSSYKLLRLLVGQVAALSVLGC